MIVRKTLAAPSTLTDLRIATDLAQPTGTESAVLAGSKPIGP